SPPRPRTRGASPARAAGPPAPAGRDVGRRGRHGGRRAPGAAPAGARPYKPGPPTRSGTGDPAGLWPWDRYDWETLCLHIAYGESGASLRMLTLMAPMVGVHPSCIEVFVDKPDSSSSSSAALLFRKG